MVIKRIEIMQERNISLDIIRTIACLLVLVIHSPIAVTETNGFLFASMTLLGSPCIGLFFMVSGYLLLPTNMAMMPFLKKRMSRVLLPTLFWTFIYLLIIYLSGERFQDQPWTKTFLSIPFTRQGCGFLWFMYALTGLYILTPIISHWVANASKREIQFVLGLWLVTTCYSLLHPFVELAEDTFGMLYYFTGYAGYFVFGSYIKRFQPKLSLIMMVGLYLVPFLIAFIAKRYEVEFLVDSFGYLCIMTVGQTIAIFLSVLKVAPPSCVNNAFWIKMLTSFSNCSFGVYLIHKLIMVDIIRKMELFGSLNVYAQILLSIITTAFVAWLFVFTISFIPHSEYIVGFRNKK